MCGLLTRSLIELQRANPGFDPKNLMTMQFRVPAAKYDTPEKIWAMFDRAIIEIRTVPGVQSAALVRAFPLTGNGEILSGHDRRSSARCSRGMRRSVLR